MQQIHVVNLSDSWSFCNYVTENRQDQVLYYAVNSNPVVKFGYIVITVWKCWYLMEITVRVCHFDTGEECSSMSVLLKEKQDFLLNTCLI